MTETTVSTYDLGDNTTMFMQRPPGPGMKKWCEGLKEDGYVCGGQIEGALLIAAIARRDDRGTILGYDTRYASGYGHADCIQRLFIEKIRQIESSRRVPDEPGLWVPADANVVTGIQRDMVVALQRSGHHEAWFNALAGRDKKYSWRPL